MKKTLIFLIISAISFMLLGCGKDNIETGTTINKGITVNEINFKILNKEDLDEAIQKSIGSLKEYRGYKIIGEDDESFFLYIGSGERNTGGYGITAISAEDNEGRTIITVNETSPGKNEMVTEALTYPYIVILLPKNIPDNIIVMNTSGDELKKIDKEQDDKKPKKFDIIGIITKIEKTDDAFIILVEGEKSEETVHDKANVSIDNETAVFLDDVSSESDLLEKGMTVKIYFSGPVKESYPVQAYAKIIYAYSDTDNPNIKNKDSITVTITKIEDYEGNLIISTSEGYRFKVDVNTKLPTEGFELKKDLKIKVVLDDSPAKADPTEFYGVSIEEYSPASE